MKGPKTRSHNELTTASLHQNAVVHVKSKLKMFSRGAVVRLMIVGYSRLIIAK